MKTIELMINGQKAQFTTKSVTLDGKEYFYSKMTKLDYSPVVHSYMFEYDGESKMLTYEKKDAKIITTIFSQVAKMIDQKNTKAAQQPEKAASAPVEKKAEEGPSDKKTETPAEESKTEESSEEKSEKDEEEKTEESAAENKVEKKAEKEPMDPEKQAKLKKSLKIFGIVLAAIVAAALIYYFVFGTSNAPTDSSPGVTESQQYEDIDQLIDDLQ